MLSKVDLVVIFHFHSSELDSKLMMVVCDIVDVSPCSERKEREKQRNQRIFQLTKLPTV